MGIPRSGQAGRRPRGELEREILACLAAAGAPLTPAQVLAALGDDLAYTTVMTTLSRLHEKGALRREPAGRAYAYSPAADPQGVRSIAVAQRMRRLLETGGDRAGVLAHFVADLPPEDEQLLADLLADVRPGSAPMSPAAGTGDVPGEPEGVSALLRYLTWLPLAANLVLVALAAASGFVADRAAALLAPAPRPRRVLAGALVLLALVTVAGTLAAAEQTDDDLDGAQRAPAATAPASLLPRS